MSKETFYYGSTWWFLGHFEPLLTWKLIMSSNLDIFEAPVYYCFKTLVLYEYFHALLFDIGCGQFFNFFI